MTAAHTAHRTAAGGHLRPPTLEELSATASPRGPQLNWPAVGVVLAILVHGATAIWFAAALDRRVTNIEQQLPPGALARLDERTLQIQRHLEQLDGRP